MADYVFREFPEHEMSAEALEARRVFEGYGAGIQSAKVQTGLSVIGGAISGAGVAGPPGAIVGAALGALSGFWKWKANRIRIYAQLDALGLLKKPRIKYRGTWDLHNAKFVFMRYPYAEQTALIIVPVLQKYYPHMSDGQLTKIATTAQLALGEFTRQHKDIPLALAAEAVLAYNGIARNIFGEYDLVTLPPPGSHYAVQIQYGPGKPPPSHIPSVPKSNSWLYAAIGIGLAFIISSTSKSV